MSSNNLSGQSRNKTRFQDATEKRRADEEIKQKAAFKRQKKMFAPKKVIGPHDILVNPHLPKIKLEEDGGCSSSVKQESMENKSSEEETPFGSLVNCEVPQYRPEIDSVVVVENRILANSAQPSFEEVLPFLYAELELNDILACRSVCCGWQDAIDIFLNMQATLLPYDKETQLKEERKLQTGRIPTWSVSPLYKLTKAYRFSSTTQLENFRKERKGKIVGSNVWLDNISIVSTADNALNGFFRTFGIHIKYLKLRQNVELPDLKIGLIIERVKLCLGQITNLAGFTVVFSVDRRIVYSKAAWRNALENEKDNNWLKLCSYPKLEKLESLVIDVENLRHAKQLFLNIFAKSLINSYSEQLKQLSILPNEYCDLEFLEVPNVVQLTIPHNFLDTTDFEHKDIEKCTFTSQNYVLKHDDIIDIQTVFPNLVCLGFKFENSGGIFHPCRYAPSTSIISSVRTLELENCGGVAFTLLRHFPNLRYLKLMNKPPFRYCGDNTKVLYFTRLWEGESLYKSHDFWENFPKITLVTLEFSGQTITNIEPKLCTWTREGYVICRSNNIPRTGQINIVETHAVHRTYSMKLTRMYSQQYACSGHIDFDESE